MQRYCLNVLLKDTTVVYMGMNLLRYTSNFTEGDDEVKELAKSLPTLETLKDFGMNPLDFEKVSCSP